MAVTNLPRVPEGLRDLVKTYTKEVLREKPKDLYKFSVDYFENLAGARKIQRKVIKYESQQSYETIMKNRIRQQLPLSLAFHIIPESLTEVIKQFIKAVLRENPQYLILFAIEYFKNLQASSSKLADIKYTAYEKFIEKTESKSPARKVTKCECGRILSSTPGVIQMEQNYSSDEGPQSEMLNKDDQYIKAVVIIQKYFRQYQIKRKAEKSSQVKIASKSADSYDSQEVLNAILLIQRQFRRLLMKNRSKETKHVNIDSYNSVKYMKAALVIQRFMRKYLRKKKSMQQKLPKPKDSTSDNNISMTTAAFVIQRAFRRMVRARRAKRHKNADLDQCDEMNDNASEAASYTSASTALLSTESAGDHDFGSTNYEEGVHQQTIREDEEVENDNTNRKMIFGAESIKTNKTSIDANEQGKPNNENFNETQLSETGDEPIDKHLRRKNSDELEKLITDDDIPKDLQAEKNNINVENQPVKESTTQVNIKTEDPLITPNSEVECSTDAKSNDGSSNNIAIQENTNPSSQSNTYISEPEQHNKIRLSTENLVLESTAEEVKQSPTTSTTQDNISSVDSSNVNVLTGRESEIIDDSNRNEIQLEQPAEKDLIKTVELEKSSAMDDNERILESAKAIEIDEAEDYNLKASKNIVANEAIPKSSSKIHINMESLPQSENVLSSSREEEVSTTTTDHKASPEKERFSSLSKFVISPEHSSLNITNMNVDNYPNELSETANSPNLESQLAAKQVTNEDSLNVNVIRKSIDCDNENIVKATITDHSIGNTPKNNQLEEIVIENINKLTSDNDVSESSHTEEVNDNIHSDCTIEKNVNETEQNEEIKVVSSNIMTEESSTKASFQETLEETESIKIPESLIYVSPTDKQFSEKSAKTSEDEPNLISLATDTFEAEQAKNTMTNISKALLDQIASPETRNTPNLECANDDIINQNRKMSSSDCDNGSPVNATTSEKDEGCDTKTEDGDDRNEPISPNKATSEIQYSIEVNSLKTVLKNLHNQAKDAHDDVLSENNTRSSEKGDTLSNTDINKKLFDDLGTSIIIHSVLPTEDDYELTILPPQNIIPLDTPDGTQLYETITESSDLNINECQSITESNTSAEDLTVIETQKDLEIYDYTNKAPNKPVDDVSEASSKMEILEETKILQNNELPTVNTEEETTYIQITINDNIETKEVSKLIDLSVKSNPLPKIDIDPPTSQKDSNECEEIDANTIQVVQKESIEEIDYGIENEGKQPIPLEAPIEMDNGQSKNENGSIETKPNSLVPSEEDSITNIVPNVGNTSQNTINNLLDGDGKQVAVIDATAPSEDEFKINDLESLKLELDLIDHNGDDTNKNENIKTTANEASDGSKSDDPISEVNNAGLANEEECDFAKDVGVLKYSEIEGASQEGASMRKLINEFLEQEIKFSSHTDKREHNMEIDEVHEPECVKRTVSLFSLDEDKSDCDEPENRKENRIQHPNESESDLDTLDSAALKLLKTDQIIEKMSRRRSSEIREKEEKDDCNIRDPAFDEPIIQPMSDLQNQNSIDIEDGDIVYKRLQRDETRESSAQSESVIFGNADEEKTIANDSEIVRSQLSRHYTIAGDDPKTIFKSVIINDSIKYIADQNENGNENEHAIDGSKGSNSFCLDDETSENIRKKMMAYSISEADSDYCDPNKIVKDDFHIDTAMTDAMDTSTETESTIVSAAAKIQAGARGFLTRRRLRRASAGTKSSTQETKASFGNDAISESLERFIEEEAAKKIQSAYRLHSKKPKNQAQSLMHSSSLESTLAAKRQTLQRGDALQNDSNSTPEDENTDCTTDVHPKKNSGIISSPNKGTRSIRRADMRMNWPVLRQNSMPVQIECEVLRVIPKHKRRRIRSAQDKNKKN